MKMKMSLKLIWVLLALPLLFVACSDDKEEEYIPAKELTIDNTSVTLLQEDEIIVRITSGNGDYTLESMNTKVATATLSGDEIKIKGATTDEIGSTTIIVKDARNQIAKIEVKVGKLWDLLLNKEKLDLYIGAEETINIVTGNGDYKVTISDGADQILEVGEITGQVFTLKALSEGKATLTITDKREKQVTLKVEVRVFELSLEKVKETIIGPGTEAQVKVLTGNGDYTFAYSTEGVVEATAVDNVIVLKGIALGTSKVTVKDAKGKTAVIEVTVESLRLEIEKESVVLRGTRSVSEVKILGGNGGYTFASSINGIVTVAEQNNVISLTAISAGKTTITVSDAAGNTKGIEVEVKMVALDLQQGTLTLNDDLYMLVDYKSLANIKPEIKSLSKLTYEIYARIDDFRGGQTYMGVEENLTIKGNGDKESKLEIHGWDLSILGSSKLEKGKWYHIALVFDGTKENITDKYALYLNGVKEVLEVKNKNGAQSIVDISVTKTGDAPNFAIGSAGRKGQEWRVLHGAMSEARVWTVARTEAQIKSNMCKITETNPQGLLSQWQFTYGISTDKFADMSGNNVDAIVYKNKDYKPVSVGDASNLWVDVTCL